MGIDDAVDWLVEAVTAMVRSAGLTLRGLGLASFGGVLAQQIVARVAAVRLAGQLRWNDTRLPDADQITDELRLIIEQGGEQGILEAEEEQMIHAVIELGDQAETAWRRQLGAVGSVRLLLDEHFVEAQRTAFFLLLGFDNIHGDKCGPFGRPARRGTNYPNGSP